MQKIFLLFYKIIINIHKIHESILPNSKDIGYSLATISQRAFTNHHRHRLIPQYSSLASDSHENSPANGVSHKQKRRTRKRSRSKNREDWIRRRANCPRLTEEVKHHCSPSGMMNSNVRTLLQDTFACQSLITSPWLSLSFSLRRENVHGGEARYFS